MTEGGLIWLASYPKSGNTWMRCLIEAYSNNGYLDINNMRSVIGDSGEYIYQSVSGLDVGKVTELELYMMRPSALMTAMGYHKKPRFIKTHFANLAGNEFPPLIPAAITDRAIYIVRDPRSVAVSWARHFGKDMESVVKMLSDERCKLSPQGNGDGHTMVFASSWTTNVTSWRKKRKYPVMFLRYEDLVEDTVGMMTKVAEFLDWGLDEPRIKRAVRACSLRQLQKRESEEGFKEKSRYTDRFFGEGGTRWKDELAPKFIRQIEKDHGPLMKDLGYL